MITLMARLRATARCHIARTVSARRHLRALGLAEAGADGLDVPAHSPMAGENQESDAWRKLLQPLCCHKVKTMSIEALP